jgi:hypothetical protein
VLNTFCALLSSSPDTEPLWPAPGGAEVQFGALQVGAGRGQLGIAACLVGNAGLNLGLQTFVAGQIALHTAFGARQFGFGLGQIQGGIAVVQLARMSPRFTCWVSTASTSRTVPLTSGVICAISTAT